MNNETARGYFDTPALSYVGSKWKIAEWIISFFPPHDTYVEPFAGSGAVFFRKHKSSVEVLNDLDRELVNFFMVLRDHEAALIRAIDLTPYSRAEYELAISGEQITDPVERARRLYVGVWQSFGSTLIYRSGWRRDIQNRRSQMTDSWSRLDGLMAAARRLKQAQIECDTAMNCIIRYDTPKTLFYVDPPYVFDSRSGGSRRRYRHEMSDVDHRQLANALNNVQGMVILSGYDSDLYRELYPGWSIRTKSATTNGNGTATEYLWINPRAGSLNVLPLFGG